MSDARVVVWLLCSIFVQVPTAHCIHTNVTGILTASAHIGQSPTTPMFIQTPWEDEDILSENVRLPRMYLNWSDCQAGRIVQLTGERGEIRGFVVGHDADRAALLSYCKLIVTVPAGMYAVAEVRQPNHCLHSLYIDIFNHDGIYMCSIYCTEMVKLIYSPSNKMTFVLHEWTTNLKDKTFPEEYPSVVIRFQATAENLALRPKVVFSTPTAGSLTPHGYDGIRYIAGEVTGTYLLRLPAEHVVMISFPHLANSHTHPCERNSLTILTPVTNGSTQQVHRECFDRSLPAEVYNTPLTVLYMFRLGTTPGFRMLFSFHPASESPKRLESGLYDCSVPHYARFKQHLHCNLVVECAGGQDEGQHCAFSPPGCEGKPGHRHKCYSLLHKPKGVTWHEARRQCRQLGGDLAMMKTEGEWRAFTDLFNYGRERGQTFVGLTHWNDSMPAIYRHSKMWVDGTVLYNRDTYVSDADYSFPARLIHFPLPLIWLADNVRALSLFACQFGAEPSGNSLVKLPAVSTTFQRVTNTNGSLVLCQSGHVTKDFLSCDPLSHCVAEHQSQCSLSRVPWQGVKGDVTQTDTTLDGLQNRMRQPSAPPVSVEMFTCANHRGTLPYTLVCDFRADCTDRSDESFCHHAHCDGFTCRNGQCILTYKRCNGVIDCLDASDEVCRSKVTGGITKFQKRLAAPAIVTFQGDGLYTQEAMLESQACPETHFRCPGESNYCLPVYVRCNGVYDCVGHEDEAHCQSYTCPGFYRCRASSVCVHLDHLCDGWPQCPQRDDELLCDFTFPQGCGCQGLAFVCSRFFPASQYPGLRYLDATGSEMTIEHLESNNYLVWLRLAFCRIGELSVIPFKNLKTLDLSHNRISVLNLNLLLTADNLEVLSLASNPLSAITYQPIHTESSRLRHLDLSHTYITVFDGSQFTAFPHIDVLNMSFSRVEAITDGSFQHFPGLAELDMTGVSVRQVSPHLFQGLGHLRQVSAGDYRLCCPRVLPDNFGDKLCFAPGDQVSSCQQLLGSHMHLLLLWTVGLLALLANTGCLLAGPGNASCFLASVDNAVTSLGRSTSRPSTGPGISVLVSSLQLANLAMGLYCAILTAADRVLSGRFVLHQEEWTSSMACRTAGFLWMMSSQASVFLLCMITLDSLRAVGIPLPVSTAMFSSRHAALFGSVSAWLLAVSLAAVPLVPGASDWQLYGQNALCLPLSLSSSHWPGRHFVLGVLAVLDFVLSVLIAVGQLLVDRTVRAMDSDLRTSFLLSKSRATDLRYVSPTAHPTTGGKTNPLLSGVHRGPETFEHPQPHVHSSTARPSESNDANTHDQPLAGVREAQPSSVRAVDEMSSARCLVSVAMTDAVCLFSVGLLGLLVWLGLDGAAGLFGHCVMYAVPLNSALNPLLYVYNVRAEKQREAEKARLLAMLKVKVASTADANKRLLQATAVSRL